MLHADSTPIKDEGVGWKIFNPDGGSLVDRISYFHGPDGVVVFDDSQYFRREDGNEEREIGFCFFLAKEEAIRAAKGWNLYDPPMVRRIRYWGGLGTHEETNFIAFLKFKIALCRSFKRVGKPVKMARGW